MQMPLPVNSTHATTKVRAEDNKKNRKRNAQGEKNTSKAKKVKEIPQNKTATKSSDKTQKPPNPKGAEYQASVTAVKEIYNSFSAAGFPPSAPVQPPPPSMQPALSSVQPRPNLQHWAPTPITIPTGTPCTLQQQNVDPQATLSAGFLA